MYSAHMRQISSAPDVKRVEAFADEPAFYNLFLNFNRRHRRVYASLPTIRGATVNLYSLFTSVVKHGGYSKVNEQGTWEKIASEIGCPPACANCNVALRRVYCQYLVAFENESFPHFKNDSLWSQLQDEFNENSGDVSATPSVEKTLGIFNPKPSPIHSVMHRSATHLGFIGKDFYPIQSNQNSRFPSSFDQLSPSQQLEELHSRSHPSNYFDLHHASVMATAEKSLMSGLPNEVDLSLNSVLFLSAVVHPSPATPLRLSNGRNILQLMLATVGIFEDGASSLRQLNQAWNSTSNLNFDEFWRDAVDDRMITFFLREDAYLYQEHSQPLVQDAETAGYRVVPPPSPDTTHDLFSPSSSHARQFFGPIGSTVGCGGDDCLSSNAPLSRVLMVVATLVNCVTPPYLAGLPPSREEDDDEIEQVMAFASVKNRRIVSGINGLNETDGRPIRGRSLFYAPGLVPPLSTWRENARFLSSQPSVLRFAFLCAYARHSALRQLGLQLVSGLRYPLNPTTLISVTKSAAARVPRPLHLNTFTGIELISIRFLVRCLLQSADRCDLLAGLSLLTNLLRVPEGVNVECLFAGLPRFLWCRLIQLLCLSDLGLVCAVLEALYTATGMGALACTRLWGCLAFADETVAERAPTTVFAARRASIHLRPLLALLSLEGQSMGPSSLHRVKVMQRHPQPVLGSVPPTSPITMGSPVMHHLQSFHPCPQSYLPHPQSTTLQNFLHQTPQCPPSSQLESGLHLVPSRSPILPPQRCQNLPFSPRPSTSSSSSPLANLLGPSSYSPSTATAINNCHQPQVVNVKSEVSSLSELTDRLQMPPPQMPPPRRTSNRVNGAVAFSTLNGSPLVNGKISSPSTNSVLNHRLSQHQQLSPQKPSSKSLLDEVLNAPSNKTLPPLINGCISGRDTIHPSVSNDVVVGAVPSIKLVNGESYLPVNLKQLPAKSKSSPVNGVVHDNRSSINAKEVEKLKKGKANLEEDGMEAKLLEAATFFTHYFCFNRNVGFHYTRKRSRDFALRNRILNGTTATSFSSFSSSSSTKRSKVDLINKSAKPGGASSQLPHHQLSPLSQPSLPMFVCEWRGCLQRFPVAKQLSCHVYKSHIKPSLPAHPAAAVAVAATSSPIERHCCQWRGCSSAHLPRAPLALMSHLLEHHCFPGELELRRQSTAIHTSTDVALSFDAPPSISSPVAAGLPDQSGWSIIKEVEARRLKSDLWISQCGFSGRCYSSGGGGGGGRIIPPPREGPVTKHLRVTAALILRNLAKHVPEARRWLLSETPLLCEIAMGTCPGASSLRTNDASRIIAQCLSICTSHHLHNHNRCDGSSGDEVTEDYSFCCCADDDYFYNEGDFSDGYYEASSTSLPLLRQRSSVDLDA